MKSQEPSQSDGSDRASKRRSLLDIALSMGIFSAVGLAAFRLFFIYGKSLMWKPDGPAAHYPSVYFLNLWLRRYVYNPELGLPLWSWTIGLGADVISTLSWSVVGDPFALVTLAFPMAYLEYSYALAYALRILCAGLFSLLYFRKMGAKPLPALTGSLIYVFTTFLLFSTTRHAFFVNAMVFLPLLLMGVENALARRRSWTLVIAVFFAAASNWYFFYMLTIITVIYAVARHFELAEKADRFKTLAFTALRVGGLYLLGGLLAAPLLIPTLVGVLNTARGGADYQRTLFYSALEYRSIIQALGTPVPGAYSTYLGFAYLGLVLLPVLYLRPGRSALKFMLPLLTLFVSLPFFGSLFNGLMFPSNRWAFALGIFIALSAASVLSDDVLFTRREVLAMCGGFVGYVILVVLVGQPLSAPTLVPMLLGALTILVLAYDRIPADDLVGHSAKLSARIPERWRSSAARWAILCLLVVNVIVTSTAIQDVRYGDTLSAHLDRGKVRGRFTKSEGGLVKTLPENGFFRVRTESIASNASLVLKVPSTSLYFSIINGHLTELKKEICVPGGLSFSFRGFDDRAGMLALVGTKFYLADKADQQFVPFGYQPFSDSKAGAMYRSSYALPLGFVYDSVLPRSRYESLSAIDKQSAMLQAAVVDDEVAASLPGAEFESEAVEVPYSVQSTEGATFDAEGGTLVRTIGQGSVTLAVEPVPGAELYVEVNEFDNVIQSPLAREAQALGDKPSRIDVIRYRQGARDFRQPGQLSTAFSAGGRMKSVAWKTPTSTYYWGDRSQLVNLGYFEDGADTIRIAPEGIGTLSFESLKVYAVPMNRFPERIAKLKASPLRDVITKGDTVTGKVSSASDGLLFLSIPYTSGWTATVDGKPAKIVRVNTAFSGVKVEAGEHVVELKYFTPGLKAGLLAAAASALVLLGMGIVGVMRARRKRVDGEGPPRPGAS